jgi:hypothetical protein
MRGVILATICCVLFAAITGIVRAGTYTFTDGTTLSGEPIAYSGPGVIIKSDTGVQPRVPWSKFSQESLKLLRAEAKNPRDASYVVPFLDDVARERPKKKEMPIKPVEPPTRPSGRTGFFAAFGSPLGLVLILLVYAANLLAAFEIAIYRNRPIEIVCGLSAVVPIVGPAIFLCLPALAPMESSDRPLPTEPEPYESSMEAEPPVSPTPSPSPGRAAGAATYTPPPPPPQQRSSFPFSQQQPPAAAESAAPKTITFERAHFTFNRRFFETKVPGFFRIVPSEAEKDLVLAIKSARGDFVGKRISSITQTDLTLQIFKEEVSADEKIPFNEIQEVQVRHKDVT